MPGDFVFYQPGCSYTAILPGHAAEAPDCLLPLYSRYTITYSCRVAGYCPAAATDAPPARQPVLLQRLSQMNHLKLIYHDLAALLEARKPEDANADLFCGDWGMLLLFSIMNII